MELNGRTALITGASSGIGAAVAERLAAEGMTVGLCARREAELEQVAERCRSRGVEARWWSIDLADLDAVVRFGVRADDELGGVDLLVNNAGIPKRRTVLDLRFDEIDGVIAVNYLSPVRLIKVLLPRMLERGRGAIVNVSSVAARLAPAGEAAYSASKAALTAFSEAIAVELWHTPVSVHLIDPAVIDTPLFDLPDNDPPYASVDPLSPTVVADAMIEQLRSGTFEVYVPPEFEAFATGKATNLQQYLAGSADYYRSVTSEGER